MGHPSSSLRPARWLVLFIATSVIWGSSFLFIRVAVEHMPPSAVVFGRTILGAAFLVPLAVRCRAFRGIRRVIVPVIVVTVLDLAAPTFLTAWGEQHVSSSMAGILTATDPLFTAILALWLIRSEVPDRKRLAGLVVGFGGVIALLGIDVRGRAAQRPRLRRRGPALPALAGRRAGPGGHRYDDRDLQRGLPGAGGRGSARPPAAREQPAGPGRARDRQHRAGVLAVLPADRRGRRGHRLGHHLRHAGCRSVPRRRPARRAAHHRRGRRAAPDRRRCLAGDPRASTGEAGCDRRFRRPGPTRSARIRKLSRMRAHASRIISSVWPGSCRRRQEPAYTWAPRTPLCSPAGTRPGPDPARPGRSGPCPHCRPARRAPCRRGRQRPAARGRCAPRRPR
jgi:EamA-like transporter family